MTVKTVEVIGVCSGASVGKSVSCKGCYQCVRTFLKCFQIPHTGSGVGKAYLAREEASVEIGCFENHVNGYPRSRLLGGKLTRKLLVQ